MEDLAGTFIDIFPFTDNVAVHKERNVQRHCLCCHARRGIIYLWKKEKLALSEVIVSVILREERSLEHFSLARRWNIASGRVRLILGEENNACHVELAA
jgi:hypothetical protein